MFICSLSSTHMHVCSYWFKMDFDVKNTLMCISFHKVFLRQWFIPFTSFHCLWCSHHALQLVIRTSLITAAELHSWHKVGTICPSLLHLMVTHLLQSARIEWCVHLYMCICVSECVIMSRYDIYCWQCGFDFSWYRLLPASLDIYSYTSTAGWRTLETLMLSTLK